MSQARDEFLWRMVNEGWGEHESGTSEAPTGWFAIVTVAPNELAEVQEAFDIDPAAEGANLIGFFLLREDNNGFKNVVEYPTKAALLRDFDSLEQEYDRWDNDDDGEDSPFGFYPLNFDDEEEG